MLTVSQLGSFQFQLELILRMLISVVCGAVIGYERRKSQKDAGIRTHIFVALGSCIFTLCSKYAFYDVLAIDAINVDVSRIASNLVTGCCFLGAGVIFIRNKAVTGLTTAAGIWVVAGIGLCFGSGMYVVGAGALLIDILIQYGLHGFFIYVEGSPSKQVVFVIDEAKASLDIFADALKNIDRNMMVMGVSRKDNDSTLVTVTVKIRTKKADLDILDFMKRYPYVISAEL